MVFIVSLSIFIFFLNFIILWQFYYIKEERQERTFQILSDTMIISAFLISLFNSGFFRLFFKENISYFGQFWTWFLLLGIVFILIGLKLHSLAKKALNVKKFKNGKPILMKKGIFEITRHPLYLSWFFIFLGLTFVMDSFVALIFCPILAISIELLGSLEEKYILIPNYGKEYEKYKEKSPNRLISQPYNYLLIIIAILVIYIGFINLSELF